MFLSAVRIYTQTMQSCHRHFPVSTKCARIVLIVLFVLSTAAAQAAQLRENTAAIAAGADSKARRQAITDALNAVRIEYRLEEFMFPRFSGTNIVVDVG
jgi:hypothetical protein